MKIMRGIAVGVAIAALSALTGCASSANQPTQPATSNTSEVQNSASEKKAEEAIKRIFGTRASYNVHGVTNFVHDDSVRDGFIATAHVVMASADGACLYTFEVLNDPHAGWNMYKKVGGEIDKTAFDKASAAHEPFADAIEYNCQSK